MGTEGLGKREQSVVKAWPETLGARERCSVFVLATSSPTAAMESLCFLRGPEANNSHSPHDARLRRLSARSLNRALDRMILRRGFGGLPQRGGWHMLRVRAFAFHAATFGERGLDAICDPK
jgi:hypothetical protein